VREPATRAAVEGEFIRTGANLSTAARALGVPVHDLRLLTRAIRGLIEAALEAEEQALDEAEGVLHEAVRSGDKRRRIAAAGFILRMSEAGDVAVGGRGVRRRTSQSSRKPSRSNGSIRGEPCDRHGFRLSPVGKTAPAPRAASNCFWPSRRLQVAVAPG
jgi:hypothetical protein